MSTYPINPPIPSTSGVAIAIGFEGFQLQVGNGQSPEGFTTICNVSNFDIPMISEVVDVTNAGCAWRARIPTLLDMGKITFSIFWVMEEETHENDINGAGATQVRGVRYLWKNQILANWKAIYNDSNYSTDYFQAYVTSFSTTGKVGGVWETKCELSNSVLGSQVPILQ